MQERPRSSQSPGAQLTAWGDIQHLDVVGPSWGASLRARAHTQHTHARPPAFLLECATSGPSVPEGVSWGPRGRGQPRTEKGTPRESSCSTVSENRFLEEKGQVKWPLAPHPGSPGRGYMKRGICPTLQNQGVSQRKGHFLFRGLRHYAGPAGPTDVGHGSWRPGPEACVA